jgi:hypothetical protein
MDTDIGEGQVVYTSDGEKLGTVKEIAQEGVLRYPRIGVLLRPDYWFAASWVSRAEVKDGNDCLMLEFPEELLDTYGLPQPR